MTATKSQPNVLASVDAGNPEHDALNRAIGQRAEELATLLNGELHLASIDCASTSAAIPDETVKAYRARALQGRTEALQQLADGLRSSGNGPHVITDEIVVGLQRLVRDHSAEILVMGTAARTGLQRLFVGNTAEAVLKHITDTDILLIPSPHR